MLDRDPMSLIATQAGVSSNADDVVINGTRSSFSNVTLDGINIQDNFIRTGGLAYQPNLLLMDQVSEFTISTSNTNATVGGGSSQITISTPSGGNQFHGAGYWYNRNNALAADSWFDNKDGIPKSFLNQSQLRQVNILQAAGVKIDPVIQNLISQIPTANKINNFRAGDSSQSQLRNTAGYSFHQQSNRTRDNVTVRGDYNMSTRNAFSTSFLWNRDDVDRPDAENDFSIAPKVINYVQPKFLSSSWRWNPGARFVNEVRGGFNLVPGDFLSSEKFPSYFVGGLVFSNPVNTFQDQGRNTNTYTLGDNATYIRGRHTLQFGFQTQQVRIQSYDAGGTIPSYGLGNGDGQDGLTARQLPGIGASDLANANQLLATLGGLVDSYDQFFNVTSRTSGFVNGAPFLRHYSFNNYAGYLHDTWKVSPRLTLTLGLRYEYFSVLTERDSLELMPVIQSGNAIN